MPNEMPASAFRRPWMPKSHRGFLARMAARFCSSCLVPSQYVYAARPMKAVPPI